MAFVVCFALYTGIPQHTGKHTQRKQRVWKEKYIKVALGEEGSGKKKGNSNKLSQVLFGKTRRPTVPREQELHPHKPISDIIAFSRLMNATPFPTRANFEGGRPGGKGIEGERGGGRGWGEGWWC